MGPMRRMGLGGRGGPGFSSPRTTPASRWALGISSRAECEAARVIERITAGDCVGLARRDACALACLPQAHFLSTFVTLESVPSTFLVLTESNGSLAMWFPGVH